MDNQPNQQQFPKMLRKLLSIAELATTALAAAGLVVHFAGTTLPEVLMIGLSGLAVVYFLSAFQVPEKPSTTDKSLGTLLPALTNKVIGTALSVCCIGILFSILGLEGSANMLLIGVLSLAAGIVISAFVVIGNSSRLDQVKPGLLRAIPVCLISAYFLVESL